DLDLVEAVGDLVGGRACDAGGLDLEDAEDAVRVGLEELVGAVRRSTRVSGGGARGRGDGDDGGREAGEKGGTHRRDDVLLGVRAATSSEQQVSVQEHPDPEPGAGEILVRGRAAGLNGADMLQRRGFYPAPLGSSPDIPGLELAGEVVGLGPGATRFATGDRA